MTQAALFSIRRAPSWDEAVYLSQVRPGVPAVFFAASRARGITMLIAPVTATTSSVAAVRLFLEVASALGLVGAMWAWVPIIGWAAPMAAFVLGFSWLGLFYGSEAMPNLWVGLAGLATAGFWIRSLDERRRHSALAWSAVCLGAVGLLRPLDALVLGVVLAGSALAARRRTWSALAAVAAGLAVGWAPWLIEMSVRFGGLRGALRAAASTGHVAVGSIGHTLAQQLLLTDGPALGPDRSGHVPALGVLWWGGTIAGIAVAFLRADRGARRTLAIVTVAGLAIAAEYLVFVQGLAPRFLLPAYALLSIPTGVGLAAVVARPRRRALAALVMAVVLGWAVAQGLTARRIETGEVVARRRPVEIGTTLRRLASGRPCPFVSAVGYPQIQLASGCVGRAFSRRDARRAEFLVLPRSTPAPSQWTRRAVVSGHVIYRRHARRALPYRCEVSWCERR